MLAGKLLEEAGVVAAELGLGLAAAGLGQSLRPLPTSGLLLRGYVCDFLGRDLERLYPRRCRSIQCLRMEAQECHSCFYPSPFYQLEKMEDAHKVSWASSLHSQEVDYPELEHLSAAGTLLCHRERWSRRDGEEFPP